MASKEQGDPHQCDVLVIGSGAAGLTAALNLAQRFKVTVLAKGGLDEGSTAWAQGGIAAVLEPGDTFESHIEDTMVAGAGLNDRATVELVVENAPAAIARLVELGVPFNMDGNALHLTREGGHSARRIVHVDDATGWAVQEALIRAARANPNITLVPDMVAIDLATSRHELRYSGAGKVWGVYAVNRATGGVELFTANATVLATGGAGRTYLFSTAPKGATGDGIAMAWRAGCRISNMEMMQFHPTCLYNLDVKNFLITEAVRGEGGRLINPQTGKRFMEDYDPDRMELAPRDVVARAIDAEIKRDGLDYVHLDISHIAGRLREGAFPQHLRQADRARHRHDDRTDPGRPGAALYLWRDRHRPRRAYRPARALCRGRVHRKRTARREPARQQLAARMFRVRRGGGAAYRGALGRSARAARHPAVGREPGHRFGRRGGHQAELDRNPPLHVELCRHRADDQAA